MVDLAKNTRGNLILNLSRSIMAIDLRFNCMDFVSTLSKATEFYG